MSRITQWRTVGLAREAWLLPDVVRRVLTLKFGPEVGLDFPPPERWLTEVVERLDELRAATIARQRAIRKAEVAEAKRRKPLKLSDWLADADGAPGGRTTLTFKRKRTGEPVTVAVASLAREDLADVIEAESAGHEWLREAGAELRGCFPEQFQDLCGRVAGMMRVHDQDWEAEPPRWERGRCESCGGVHWVRIEGEQITPHEPADPDQPS